VHSLSRHEYPRIIAFGCVVYQNYNVLSLGRLVPAQVQRSLVHKVYNIGWRHNQLDRYDSLKSDSDHQLEVELIQPSIALRVYICVICDLSSRDSSSLRSTPAAERLPLFSACRQLTSFPRWRTRQLSCVSPRWRSGLSLR